MFDDPSFTIGLCELQCPVANNCDNCILQLKHFKDPTETASITYISKVKSRGRLMGMPGSSSITSHESSNCRRAASASWSAGTKDLLQTQGHTFCKKLNKLLPESNNQANTQALKHVRHVRTKDQC
jgi:hypothetical protein